MICYITAAVAVAVVFVHCRRHSPLACVFARAHFGPVVEPI